MAGRRAQPRRCASAPGSTSFLALAFTTAPSAAADPGDGEHRDAVHGVRIAAVHLDCLGVVELAINAAPCMVGCGCWCRRV